MMDCRSKIARSKFVADPRVRAKKRSMSPRTRAVYSALSRSRVPLEPFQIARIADCDTSSVMVHLVGLVAVGYVIPFDVDEKYRRPAKAVDSPDQWMLEQIERKRARDRMRAVA